MVIDPFAVSVAALRGCSPIMCGTRTAARVIGEITGKDGASLPQFLDPAGFVAADRDPRYVTFVDPTLANGVFAFARKAETGRVARGDCSPRAPTDPDVRISRIWLVISDARSSELRDPLSFREHVHGFLSTRHVSLQRCPETASPSLRRVPSERFPGLNGTRRRSDSPPSFSPRFVAFARPIPPMRRMFAPFGRRHATGGSGELVFRFPSRNSRWKRRGLPGSWGTLLAIARALRPR